MVTIRTRGGGDVVVEGDEHDRAPGMMQA